MHFRSSAWASCALIAIAIGCTSQPSQPPASQAETQAPAAAAAPSDRQAEFGRFPDREFLRLKLDQFQWRPNEGNTLGVETAVLEGDPSKPGFYLTINRFPPGVMSRPHYHPDERNIMVIKGTWYTDEGKEFRPDKAIPMKPGEYMRHPAGGPHYDGALDEEVWVAISGYGPTSATVIDGGELFGRSRPAPGAK
jgi:quercetin dioxygenase-like cupin family protein